MAPVWKIGPAPADPKPAQIGGLDYKAWYQQNKQRPSEKKAPRYREDAAYRAAARRRSRKQRDRQRNADDAGL